jgi:hypothetical protein
MHLIVSVRSHCSSHPYTPTYHPTIENTKPSIHTAIANAQNIGKETLTTRLACWRIKRRPATAAIDIFARISSFLATSAFKGVEETADLAGTSDTAVVACID